MQPYDNTVPPIFLDFGSSAMYNSHRGMVPAAPNTRLTELLDQVRAEFDAQSGRAGEYENQREFAWILSPFGKP